MKDQSSIITGLAKENSLLKKQVKETNRPKPGNKSVYETIRKSGEYFKAIIQNSSDVIIAWINRQTSDTRVLPLSIF